MCLSLHFSAGQNQTWRIWTKHFVQAAQCWECSVGKQREGTTFDPGAHWFLSAFADVYSFDEEEPVLDPHIAKHLAHFGIDMLQMQVVGNPSFILACCSPVCSLGGGRETGEEWHLYLWPVFFRLLWLFSSVKFSHVIWRLLSEFWVNQCSQMQKLPSGRGILWSLVYIFHFSCDVPFVFKMENLIQLEKNV